MSVPKLRFPEFRDTSEWENEPLEKLYSFKVTNSCSRDQLNYENGLVKNIHYGDIHTKFSTLFNIEKEIVPFINPSESLEKIKSECYCIEGDMIFADASEDLEDVGKSIEIVNLNNEKLLSGLHTLLARQKDKKLIIGFGGYLFKSNRIRTQIKKEAQGAKVLGISAGRLSNIEVAFPSDMKEQQKIADCLSSIDKLVTAQTQKVEALKAHKKGLMQQLFPLEGETVPKLRFPEFLDAGEWNEKPLGNVCTTISSGKDKIDSSGDFDLHGSTGVIGKTSNDSYDGNLILVARVGANAGLLTRAKGKFGVTDNTLVIVLEASEKIEFIYYSLDRLGLNKMVFGSGQPLITGGQLKSLAVSFPSPEEQQKIAACLSSIDALITAQTQKLATLKVHKKGLMQQLFPAVDEAAG